MNIIFDLGGVVLNWNPQKLIDRVTTNPVEKSLLLEHLFSHSDWMELDRGTISQEEVVKNTIKRSGLKRELIEDVFNNVSKELIPKPNTVKLIENISNTENNLYVLSNMHKRFAISLIEDYNFWFHFKGIVFSCDVKMVKPNREIFDYILNKYDLRPEDTIFIDDTKVNVEASNELGIDGILFKSPEQLKDELIKKGVI